MAWVRFIRVQALWVGILTLLSNLPVQAEIGQQASHQTSHQASHQASHQTSVHQLADVQPTDWAFQALQSLVERYGVIAGYPDGTFQGDRSLTRYEFAAALNTSLERLSELIAASTESTVAQADLAILQRLQTEFVEELAILKGRTDALEAQITELEANQFSVTTQLIGQTIFAVNAGGFAGDRILSPTGEVFREQEPNATFIYRASLDFNTSFTGTDLLKLRIDVGSGGSNDNAGGFVDPNFGSTLDFSTKPPSDGNFGIGRAVYTFQPLEDVAISIGPNIRTTDYVDRNSYANLSFRDFSTLALTNNYVLFPVNGPSAGAAIDWNIGHSPFAVRALYAAADPANSSDQGALRGTAPFTPLLYPGSLSPTADLGDRGLFGDTHQGVIELEYSPAQAIAFRVQYGSGLIFDHDFDAIGVNAEVAITPGLAVFGRYGYSRYSDTAFGEIEPNYWMAGVALPDLWQEGASAGVAVGQPFIVTEIGNATQTNIEAFYRFSINNNLQITPVIQIVIDPANRSENGTVITGTLRTVFFF